MTLLLNSLVKYGGPLVLFLWSLFSPALAGYVYAAFASVFVAYLFCMDLAFRPEPDLSIWTREEARVWRQFHLAIRFPFGSQNFSCLLNGIRWTSLIWVPWLLWNHVWIPAALLGGNFFATASLSVRLDPFFFLSAAAQEGHSRCAEDLETLRMIQAKRLTLASG